MDPVLTPPNRLLFASLHNYLDVASGAAITTRETLLALARRGWRVRVLCGCFFDSSDPTPALLRETLARRVDPDQIETRDAILDGESIRYRLVRFDDSGIDATAFVPDAALRAKGTDRAPSKALGALFLKNLDKCLAEFNPSAYLTYGGYWAADPASELARRAGCKNVFLLYNLSYRKAPLFDLFDAIVVSSEFARRRYARELGREPTAIPPLIDEGTVCDGKRRSNRSSAAFAAR